MAFDFEKALLEISGVHAVTAEDKTEILKGINLTISPGEVHVIMGPNGSGKSTLANVIAGNPVYEVTAGHIFFQGEDITALTPDARAKKGVFLAFQHPEEIPGVSLSQFLRQAMSERQGSPVSTLEVRVQLREWLKRLDLDTSFSERHLNTGFSGGEKKRNEILQMALLSPELAILDETDSGLDIDGLKAVVKGLSLIKESNPNLTILIVTHYANILHDIEVNKVHVLTDGEIVETGDKDLALKIEKSGYVQWLPKVS
ncbi:MAG: Fe-S cluster assembly ATPase SufC [Firmicutes bacterium]|jgi:Fe-S cluster assembly ATP-binding protein|nr:Fe-S cluster assembly ATPase SufC [Bacillota bacterium]